MEFLDACRRIISIDSSPGNGTKEVAEFAASLCKDFGLQVDLQKGMIGGNEQYNVVGRLVDPAEKEFLLQTHLDTGDPGNYMFWAETGKNPFEAVIAEDRIFGLGAAKAKLDFLCKLYAMKELSGEKSFRCAPVLAGTYGQQLGMSGAVQLVRYNKVHAEHALIGEPTDLSMVGAGKGVVVVEFQIPFSEEERRFRQDHDEMESTASESRMFVGKSASSSNPEIGENAIEKMILSLRETSQQGSIGLLNVDGGVGVHSVPGQAFLEFDAVNELKDPMSGKLLLLLEKIEELRERFSKYPDPEFDPAVSTLNLGLIRSFDDHILLSFSCRLVPAAEKPVYDEWVQFLRSCCEMIGANFRLAEFKRPFRTREDDRLVHTMQSILKSTGRSDRLGLQAKCNEANVFSRFGVNCVIFGPGEVERNAHTPGESVAISDLQLARKVYTECLVKMCTDPA